MTEEEKNKIINIIENEYENEYLDFKLEVYDFNDNKKKAYIIYLIQLIVNCLWPLFFFRLNYYLFSFIWILLLIGLVIAMIDNFKQINKLSAYLQIPYLLWLIFASVLNLSIYLLN